MVIVGSAWLMYSATRYSGMSFDAQMLAYVWRRSCLCRCRHKHDLRHYAATELITAGVDPCTVAGRLGHTDHGATTLKVYSAWRAEADQRAAATFAGRMPSPAGVGCLGDGGTS